MGTIPILLGSLVLLLTSGALLAGVGLGCILVGVLLLAREARAAP